MDELDRLTLQDWRRRVFELYAAIRAEPDPPAAWRRWRAERDALFAHHPATPLPADAREGFDGADLTLDLYWLEGYAGGLFVPFADATSGKTSYGAGRYLLDTVKGADLGTDDGRLVFDFNFAYNPSCSYDPQWSCPLTPPGNRLPVAIEAGERSALP